MLIQYKNETLENQIQLIENALQIECNAYRIEFNASETMFLEVSQLDNEHFLNFLRRELECLQFCINSNTQSLFFEKYSYNFLLYDFFDTFTKYKRNKFLYFYEDFFNDGF